MNRRTGDGPWNPENNNGQALELAIATGAYDCVKVVEGVPKLRTWSGSDLEEKCALTRLAIVQFASDKGRRRGMKPIVYYDSTLPCSIKKGKSACVKPINHTNHVEGQAVSNTRHVFTSVVISVNQNGEFETLNTYYKPLGNGQNVFG